MAHHADGSGCDHSHRKQTRKRLAIALVLAASYMVAEIVGGFLTNSLALLADAGHMLSDVAALGLSLFAMWIAGRAPTATRTYGYYRIEILAALINGAMLVAISFYIFFEAYQRLREPEEVLGGAMLGVAVGGLFVNLIGLFLLKHAETQNLNVRGAWLHLLTDTLGSVGAIGSAALIWAFGWTWADPVASLAIGLLVMYSSWNLLKEAVSVLMEGAPGHIDVDELRSAMLEVEDVGEVHDLHVWSITSGLECLSCHVLTPVEGAQQRILARLQKLLLERFGIDHITIQVETETCVGRTACDACDRG